MPAFRTGDCRGIDQTHSAGLVRYVTRCSPARQNNPKLGEFAGLCVDLDQAAMLLHDDVVTDGKAKPRAFSGRFSSEERREQLLLHLWQNTRAVIPDTDLHAVSEI